MCYIFGVSMLLYENWQNFCNNRIDIHILFSEIHGPGWSLMLNYAPSLLNSYERKKKKKKTPGLQWNLKLFTAIKKDHTVANQRFFYLNESLSCQYDKSHIIYYKLLLMSLQEACLKSSRTNCTHPHCTNEKVLKTINSCTCTVWYTTALIFTM